MFTKLNTHTFDNNKKLLITMPSLDTEVMQTLLKSMVKFSIGDNQNQHEFNISEETLLEHIRTPPIFTIIRVNTLITDRVCLRDEINEALMVQYLEKNLPQPIIEFHNEIEDILILKSNATERVVKPSYPQIVVGLQCGNAVLRGSQVYAPGVTAIPYGLSIGDRVSVFADLTGHCKRGWTKDYEGQTFFVGNGYLMLNRQDLFSVTRPRGLAVNMVEPLFDCPSIGDILLKESKSDIQKGFLQNLPSVLCGHALQVKSWHTVLDMCAAPGGKTTHIACLMENKGIIVALDKSAAKIQEVRENATKMGLSNVRALVFDSTKACIEDSGGKLDDLSLSCKPPFYPESFDRIILDAPCSALGQRPQLYNPIRLKEVYSFARLQKKLFFTAVRLLKVGGRMVYSTCTYNVAENEEIIDWALKVFPCLRTVSFNVQLGRQGYRVGNLKDEDCKAMQRFGSPCGKDISDTIGFFMCCLEKG